MKKGVITKDEEKGKENIVGPREEDKDIEEDKLIDEDKKKK